MPSCSAEQTHFPGLENRPEIASRTMSAQNVDALNKAGLRILSHESSVDSWAADYLVHQSSRLAEDLDILEKYASRNSTQIVEIGSSPPSSQRR